MISNERARAIALVAQGFGGQMENTIDVVKRLGAIQLDTISVLARSHELVPRARLGAIPKTEIERSYWGSGKCFEYWSHAACVLPVESWPLYKFRRSAWRQRYGETLKEHASTRRRLLRQLQNGPKTATELGGAKVPGDWWSWSDVKLVLELMLGMGEVACVERVGWRRRYALAESVIPSSLFNTQIDEQDALLELVTAAGRALGVFTEADLRDYLRIRQRELKPLLARANFLPMKVEGWEQPALLHPDFEDVHQLPVHKPVLLSPFDSLIWDRDRTERLFGYRHKLEIYVPKVDRAHGYFTMPLLANGKIVGKADPKRNGEELLIQNYTVDRGFKPALNEAVSSAAAWVGAKQIRLSRIAR